MSRIFDVVQSLSGQKNAIVIPRPYVRFFAGDQQALVLGALLNQIVFWSGVDSSCEDGWFYKSHKEMGEDLETLSEDQVGRLVKKLCTKYLPGIIETKNQKVNGTPTAHYRIDGDALIAKIFPPELDSAKVRNGKRESAESKPQNRGMETAEVQNGNRESAESFLYTDQDIQIIKPSCQPAADPAAVMTKQATQVLEHLRTKTGSRFQNCKSSLENIRARLRDGFTPDELVLVIDFSVVRWGANPDFSSNLNPTTLFRPTKFPSYLSSATNWDKAGRLPRSQWSMQAQAKPKGYVDMDFSNQDYSSVPAGFRNGYSSEKPKEPAAPVDRSELPRWLVERTGGAV